MIILASAALVGIVMGRVLHVEPRLLMSVCGVATLGACLAWRRPAWRTLALVACAASLGAVRTSLAPPAAAQPEAALEPYLGSRVRLRAQVAELPRLVGSGAYTRLVLAIDAVGPPGRDPPLPGPPGQDPPPSGAREQNPSPAGPPGHDPVWTESLTQAPPASSGLPGLAAHLRSAGDSSLVATAPTLPPSSTLRGADERELTPSSALADSSDHRPSVSASSPDVSGFGAQTAVRPLDSSAHGLPGPAPPTSPPPRTIVLADPGTKLGSLGQGDWVTLEGRLVAAADPRGPPVLLGAQLIDLQGGLPVGPGSVEAGSDGIAVGKVVSGSQPAAVGGPAHSSSQRAATWTSAAQSDFAEWMRQLGSVRQAAAANIQRFLPEPQASLATGVLLGGSGRLSSDFKLDLQRSGLTHVLAIDGYKQILVAGLVGTLVTRFFGVRLAILTTVALATGYTLLGGAHPSAVRAALMLALASLATLTGRVADPLTSLSLAVLALGAVDPSMLFDVGLQLSASATLGIILLWPRLRRRLERLPRWIAEPLGLSAAVTLATLPVTLSAFQFVSFVSPVAHVVAMPLLPLVLASTTLLAVLAAVPPAGDFAARFAAPPPSIFAPVPWASPLAQLLTSHLAPLLTWFAAAPASTLDHLSWPALIATLVPLPVASADLWTSVASAAALVPSLAALPASAVASLLWLFHGRAVVTWLAALPAMTFAQLARRPSVAAFASWCAASPTVSAITSPLGQLAPTSHLSAWMTTLWPGLVASSAADHLRSPVLVAAWLAWLPTTLLAWLIRTFGSMQAAGVSTGRLPPPAAVALAGALLGYGVWQLPELANLRISVHRWLSNHPRFLAPSACTATCIGAAVLLRLLQPDGQLHVEPLQLGSGQAVFIRGPTGATALVVSGQPSPASLTAQVAQNLAVWEHQLNLVVALDAKAERALAPTLSRYPADQFLVQASSKAPQRLEIGRGAAVDVWSAGGQLRVAIDETTSVPTTSAARPGSAD